jgi:hypothetical protein
MAGFTTTKKKNNDNNNDKKSDILLFPKAGPDWFSQLFGFHEESYEIVQKLLYVSEEKIISRVNQKSYSIGRFSTPSLAELRSQVMNNAELLKESHGTLKLSGIAGEVSVLQALEENCYATFQVASQFNCLEFVGPRVVPEDGITGYVFDRTQGPASTISCGPATAYRNYFVPFSDGIGQNRNRMLNTLQDVSDAVGNNPSGRYFRMLGGYTLATDDGLGHLNRHLSSLSPSQLKEIFDLLRIGVHNDVQVTSSHWGAHMIKDRIQLINQVSLYDISVIF